MKSTVKRLAALATVGTMAILAPVASASAATTPVTPAAFGLPAFSGWGGNGLDWGGLGGFTPGAIPYAGAGAAVVVGPIIITTAPSSFINTNNQVSAGSNVAGGQFAP